MQFAAGLLLAVFVAAAAYRAGALSPSGAVAAAALGAVVFGFGGLAWAVLLLAFFVTSSGLSRLFKRRKAGFEEKFSKSSRRDAGQVLANGGISGLFVLLHLAYPTELWPWLGFAGSLAAANADTWATELGVLSPVRPRLLTTLQPAAPGTSGAVSVAGSAAALGGAGLVGLLAGLLNPFLVPSAGAIVSLVIQVALAGLGGSLVDSLLGATLQAIYFCPVCHKETERHPQHICGSPTRLIRGLPWLDNDLVNAVCTLAGALLALFFQALA